MGKAAKTFKTKIVGFFETPAGHALLAVLAVVLAYIFASWSIDSGSLLDWAITFILLIIAAREGTAFMRQIYAKK